MFTIVISDPSRKSLSEEIFRYKSLLEADEKELTIASYVRLKRQNRGGFYISKFADFDPFSLEEELRRFGISPQLVFDALDREERDNERDIEELALQLLECLVKRNRIENEGGTHEKFSTGGLDKCGQNRVSP